MTSHKITVWLNAHPLIKVNKLEELTQCPQGTIRQALKPIGGVERGIPGKYMTAIVKELKKYGFKGKN